jgi:hypothetical protein
VNLTRYLAKQTGEVLPQRFAEGFYSHTSFLGSAALGGTWLLDQMWSRTGISKTLKTVLKVET